MNENTKLMIAGALVVASLGYLASGFFMGGETDPQQTQSQGKKAEGQKGEKNPAGKKAAGEPGDKSGANNGGGLGDGESHNEEGDDAAPNTEKQGEEKGRKNIEARDIELPTGTTVGNQKQASTVINDVVKKAGADKDTKIDVSKGQSDSHGNISYSGQQTYKGIPVMGAVSTLVVRDGKARNVFGQWSLDKIDLDVTPKFDAKQAFRMALTARGVPANQQFEIIGNQAELAVLIAVTGAKLVWTFEAKFINPDQPNQIYAVDAHTPEIILQEKVSMH